jgi:hypothetical protein
VDRASNTRPEGEGPAAQCSSKHRSAWGLVLVAFCLTVLMSGFATPLGDYRRSLWPWNRAWFMFSWNPGTLSELKLVGRLQDGHESELDMKRWFRYEAGANSPRFNEIGRDPDALRRLVHYVCRRHDEAAGDDFKLVAVTVSEVTWPQERGRRRLYEDLAEYERTGTIYLLDEPCPPGAP